MNRLFSEQEICKGCLSLGGENCEDCEYRLGAQDGATAQLAKTDKEWVEWVVTNAEVEGEDIILPGKLWRERRKEIGI